MDIPDSGFLGSREKCVLSPMVLVPTKLTFWRKVPLSPPG